MSINIGIDSKHREAIGHSLSRLLADSYTLFLKTQGFHWNVTGPHFNSLHQMFENQYNDLFTAVDEIAERIRALDLPAPASYSQYIELASVKEQKNVPNAEQMLAQLMQDHETVVRTAREAMPIAEEVSDQPTIDLLTRRMETHEKTAWMLRSTLGK